MSASAAAAYRLLRDVSTPGCGGPCPTPPRFPAVRFYFPSRRPRLSFRSRIKAESAGNRTAAVVEVIEDGTGGNGASSYDWNGNGSAYGYNGSLKIAEDGGNGVLGGNGASSGSLVKHVNGSVNGAAVKTEEKRKKTVEEIGQEEAWFKRGGKEKLEVDFQFILLCFVFRFFEFLTTRGLKTCTPRP